MPTISGQQLIGHRATNSPTTTFSAINPESGMPLPVLFHEATALEVDQAVQLAETAFPIYSQKSPEEIAQFLEQIANEILALGDTLIQRATAETALPQGRLQGERGRTMNQLKLFASVVREGSWVDARIDTAQPDRQPAPKADIRHLLRPIGPVAVFGASNFPLAFSVAGGDTASALASGCSVVIKGHPAHPGTSELVGKAIIEAAKKTGMPEGVCSLIQGKTNEVGGHLVLHPLIQAVGFTGSFRGGKALFDRANQRPVPIPVFAEMGSTNPVFILPDALNTKGAAIASGLANSITLGVGQFCTNPGLVFGLQSSQFTDFQDNLNKAINSITAGTMLTSGIQNAFEKGLEQLQNQAAIQVLSQGSKAPTECSAVATLLSTDYTNFKKNPAWAEEIFGPSSLLVTTNDKSEILSAAKNLSGHLTATIHGTPKDFANFSELFPILERKVGRVLLNGFPTGVEVCHSMVHGGPFPATTAPQTTSVGTNAIKRFVRPVCYQNFPNELLPDALKKDNPLNIWRLVDGQWKQ
ncbi:MAG: aldehyde dehydrogenase (NADP(+)) [Bacteroidota bacterium]